MGMPTSSCCTHNTPPSLLPVCQTGAATHLLRLRLKTMPERGSALLDPEASVQLYLMSEDGAALLCRLPAFCSKAVRRVLCTKVKTLYRKLPC